MGEEKFIKEFQDRLYFSTSDRHKIIQAYLISNLTKQEVWESFTGRKHEHGRILNWMRRLGYEDKHVVESSNIVAKEKDMQQNRPEQQNIEGLEQLQLKKRIEELEKQLKDAEMKATAFSTMVDIAEKEFKISIRKKFNTKP